MGYNMIKYGFLANKTFKGFLLLKCKKWQTDDLNLKTLGK